MLFLTVYGPELESLYFYIRKYTQLQGSVSREQLFSAYLPHIEVKQKGQKKNIEDAINYLRAAQLVDGDKTLSSTHLNTDSSLPFAVLLLRQLRNLEQSTPQLPLLDLLYISLLEQLFIAPNKLWISDLHAASNQLELAQQVGGISQEKVGAWKRVMEYLGVGYRIGGGFYCLYQPELLKIIIWQWTLREGTLQELFERHVLSWLPFLTARGEVALSAVHGLEWLEKHQKIRLLAKQDSPARPYFGTRALRGIALL